jgi:hypothetical protein
VQINHRLTWTLSASCSKRFSTTPFVVLQRRISPATGANENDTTHTTTVSTQSLRAERTTLKLQGSDKTLEHYACQLRSAELKSSIAHCSLLEWRRWWRRRLLARQLDNALGCERLEPQPLGLDVGLLACSSELGDVELRTHGRRGETAAALALEVVDDGGVTRKRRRAASGSGDGGGRRRRRCGRLGRGAAKDGAEARRNGAGARVLASAGRQRP